MAASLVKTLHSVAYVRLLGRVDVQHFRHYKWVILDDERRHLLPVHVEVCDSHVLRKHEFVFAQRCTVLEGVHQKFARRANLTSWPKADTVARFYVRAAVKIGKERRERRVHLRSVGMLVLKDTRTAKDCRRWKGVLSVRGSVRLNVSHSFAFMCREGATIGNVSDESKRLILTAFLRITVEAQRVSPIGANVEQRKRDELFVEFPQACRGRVKSLRAAVADNLGEGGPKPRSNFV